MRVGARRPRRGDEMPWKGVGARTGCGCRLGVCWCSPLMTHGIESRSRDKVEDDAGGDGWQWHERGVRVSVTFRWLLPGAEMVGGDSDDGDEDHQADTDGRG
ncbi:hypothetical protein F5148DRAFT_1199012, partial [Russula earlei]